MGPNMQQRDVNKENGSAESLGGLPFSVRLGIFYGALFLFLGVHIPFMPVWLDWKGLSPEAIAFLTGAPLLLRVFVTPSVALTADRFSTHREMVIGLALAGFVLGLLLLPAEGFWHLCLVVIPLTLCAATIMPLTETIAVKGLRETGADYGRMRLWGSLTFIGVGFLAGFLIDRYGPDVIVWSVALATAATLGVSLILPSTKNPEPVKCVPAADKDDGRPSDEPSMLTKLKPLLRCRVFLLFLLAAGAAQGAHGMFYSLGALHWGHQGISAAWIGALWAIGVGFEVALFAFSRAVVARIGAVQLIIVAGLASVVRWIAMAFDPPLAGLIVLQILHALTYGASHLGAVHFIARAAPEGMQGTAQAFYATVAMGLLVGAATLLSGALYTELAGMTYLVMAALSLAGLAAAFMLYFVWDGGRIGVERSSEQTSQA